MREQILSYDRHLFRVINEGWSNSFFDWLMPWMRNANLWYPLYFFLFLFVAVNFKKNWLWFMLFAVGTVVLANFISSSIIKTNFFRLRPCNVPEYSSWIHVLVGYRPQSSSFISSHAANHFAMATFLYLTLKPRFRIWPALFFIWALLICLAQVYVGVHYPLDVTIGAMFGIVIGYLCGKSFNRTHGLV